MITAKRSSRVLPTWKDPNVSWHRWRLNWVIIGRQSQSSASRKTKGSNHSAGKIFQYKIFVNGPANNISDNLIGNYHVWDVNCYNNSCCACGNLFLWSINKVSTNLNKRVELLKFKLSNCSKRVCKFQWPRESIIPFVNFILFYFLSSFTFRHFLSET